MAFTYTNPTLTPNQTPMKKVDTQELQTDYKTVEGSVVFSPAVNITLPVIDVIAKTTDITSLRSALNNLETKFSGNCNCTNCTNCNCCQTCQSCQVNCSECFNTNCSNCCFARGSLVLMADRTWKLIEQLKVGDTVKGIDGRDNTVTALHMVKLGDVRTMLKFPGGLRCSAEHLFWVRSGGREWFGTRDYNQYLREKAEYGCLQKSDPIVLTGDEEYLTLGGWTNTEPVVDRSASSEEVLYSPMVDGSHTLIANGYVTGVFVSDSDFDYSRVKGGVRLNGC